MHAASVFLTFVFTLLLQKVKLRVVVEEIFENNQLPNAEKINRLAISAESIRTNARLSSSSLSAPFPSLPSAFLSVLPFLSVCCPLLPSFSSLPLFLLVSLSPSLLLSFPPASSPIYAQQRQRPTFLTTCDTATTELPPQRRVPKGPQAVTEVTNCCLPMQRRKSVSRSIV